jgi:predicted dehydrogenase
VNLRIAVFGAGRIGLRHIAAISAVSGTVLACVIDPAKDAQNVAAARGLANAAQAAGIASLTGHHRRHNPVIAAAKAMIDSGKIGPVVSVQAQFWLCKPDDYFDVASRVNPVQAWCL